MRSDVDEQFRVEGLGSDLKAKLSKGRVEQDAIQLQVEEESINNLHRSYSPFDPLLISNFNYSRTKAPAFSQLQGAAVQNSVTQATQLTYVLTFETGTNLQAGFSVNKFSTNSNYYFLNPSFSSSLLFSVAQPLLRNFGVSASRAPILLAQRDLRQAHANFEVEVVSAVLSAMEQHWAVILDRESLAVEHKSLDSAQRSYDRDKRSLSLGVLAPVDTYRSEAQVAARKLSLIQVEYQLIRDEDALRRTIGADLDPSMRALELQLTESPEAAGALAVIDMAEAQSRALANQSELDVARLQLANDELNLHLAHNHLRPDLELQSSYSGNGLGGTSYNIAATPPVLISNGGLTDSLSQLLHFNYSTYNVGSR